MNKRILKQLAAVSLALSLSQRLSAEVGAADAAVSGMYNTEQTYRIDSSDYVVGMDTVSMDTVGMNTVSSSGADDSDSADVQAPTESISGEQSSPDEIEQYTPDDFDADSIFDALPDELREYLPEGAESFDPELTRESFTFGFFANLILKLISAAINPAAKTFATLLGLTIIASVTGSLKGIFKSDGISSLFDFMSGLCIMLAMFSVTTGLFDSVSEYLARLSVLVNAIIPVMTAMNVAGGNLGSAAVSANAMMLSVSFIQLLATSVMFPVLRICYGMSIASGLGGVKLDGITKLIRGLLSWVLGIIAALIGCVMSFQNSIAARADSLAMRAVKFAASGAIPVVGSIAGDAVRTVAGSLTLVRTTVGWTGVILILLLTLPVIIEVLLTRLGVVLAETAANIIGCERERGLLNEISGLLGFLAAVSVISGLMFIYALTLFATSSAALAG